MGKVIFKPLKKAPRFSTTPVAAYFTSVAAKLLLASMHPYFPKFFHL